MRPRRGAREKHSRDLCPKPRHRGRRDTFTRSAVANARAMRISDVRSHGEGFQLHARLRCHRSSSQCCRTKQNVDISGTIGPLVQDGRARLQAIAPFAIEAKVGPLELARLRTIGSIGKSMPEALSVPDPVSLAANADGTFASPKFHLESDLSANRIAWADSFDKPASVPLKVSARWFPYRCGPGGHAGEPHARSDLDANAAKHPHSAKAI